MTLSPRRILIITRNLPPLVGGMERLNWHMAAELAKVAEVRVVGPQGATALAPDGVSVREAPLKPLGAFLWHARKLARREAKAWRPDIVLAGSGLTAPLVRAAARTCGARTIVYVHGLDVAVKHPAYRAFWLPAIRRMDRVIANSRATAKLCRDIGIDPARIGIVHPGVDLPSVFPSPSGRGCPEGAGEGSASRHVDVPRDFAPSPPNPLPAGEGNTKTAFRAHHHLGDRPLLLSVGRLSARKGLREFVTQSLLRIVAAQPDVLLLIVGDAPADALGAQAQSPQSIQTAADAAGVGKNIRFLGKIEDAELAAAYRAADVHVFPIRHIPGNPEGFGMVAVEAAAHGLPTVAFANGGVIDAVAEGRSGRLVTSDDYESFADAVSQVLVERGALHASCVTFAQGFAWPVFGANIEGQLMQAVPDSVPGSASS